MNKKEKIGKLKKSNFEKKTEKNEKKKEKRKSQKKKGRITADYCCNPQ